MIPANSRRVEAGNEAMVLMVCPFCHQYVDALFRVKGFDGMRCDSCIEAIAEGLRDDGREHGNDRFFHAGRGL